MSNARIKGRWARALLPVCLLLVTAIVLAALPLIPPSLVVSSHGKVLYEKVVGSTECEVDFRHSVNKGHIREVYRIDPDHGRITLQECYFENYGAGMIDQVPPADGFRIDGKYMVISFPEQWKKEINYIGGKIAKHYFLYGDDRLDVGEQRPQQPFTLSVERRSLWNVLFRRRSS